MVRSPLGELASRVHGLKTLLLCASHGGPTMITVLAWSTVLLLVLTASSQAQQTSPVQQTDDVAFRQELEKGKRSISARYDDALQSLRRANEMRDKKCAACYAWMTDAYLSLDDDAYLSHEADARSHEADAYLSLEDELRKRLTLAEKSYAEGVH